jgi:rhomboid protease GluP
MPEYQQTIAVHQYTPARSLQMAYGCFQQLGWTVEYAFANRLVGYTKKQFNSYADHILVDVEDGILTITSKLPQSASWDILKKNKKNVTRFISCFENIPSANDAQLQTWQSEIESLQQKTETALEREQKEAAEVESVMNLSSGSRTITYSLIALNVLIFLMMVINGVGIFEPLVSDLLKWGGNFKPYTTGGEWWRLITCMFVHIGIIHIALNMYALFSVGVYLEPMLGKARYIVAYLCTGIFASLASLWWHNEPTVSAGASGAIFGLYGVFLALLTTKLIPARVRSELLRSIGIFVVYNLVYGMKGGVDNAAHVGGLISGFIVGYIYFLSLRKPNFKPVAAGALIVLITAIFTYSYLGNSKDDTVAYEEKLQKLQKLEEEALAPLRKTNSTEYDLMQAVTHTSQVKWQEAKKLIGETSGYELPQPLAQQRTMLKEYIDLRIQQTDLIVLSLNENHDKEVETDLQKITEQINEKLKKFEELK